MASEQAEKQESGVARASSYFSDSWSELKKVTHPTKQETIQATVVTLIIVTVVAVSLFLLDLIFNRLMLALLS